MPKINVLPDHIASQIAAGEVVERPASVVKELVENSIDAGATQIEIAVGAGCRDIRIADDGCGMSPEDAVLAFQRHATSKINTAEDLFSLTSLGFRGEALPSIASIAKVTCYTRSSDAPDGTKVELADGQLTAKETGCAVGTVLEICDLFYNVPARLNFLKKASTEFAHIHETIQSMALAFPKIVFQLLNDGEVVLRTSGSGKLAEVMVEVGLLNGREELVQLTGVDMKYGLAIYGYAARPPHCRGDRKGIVTVVNNRIVRCPLTYRALDYAFSDLIPRGRYPYAVLTITLDPNQIDVNVHPTKKEIKYGNSQDIYLAIQRALVEGLRAFPGLQSSVEDSAAKHSGMRVEQTTLPVVEEAFSQPQSLSPIVRESLGISQERSEVVVGGRTLQKIQQLGLRDRFVYSPPSRISGNGLVIGTGVREREPSALPLGWRLAGYIFNTYMLFETPEGFKIIEQHIAHERLIYERLLALQKTKGRVNEMVQHLVISVPLSLSPAQRACLEENIDTMQSLGFDFDFQANIVSCTSVPLELASKDYVGTVQQNIEQILNVEGADFCLEATKSLACQAAIKNGMAISEAEICDLVAEWLQTPRRDTCPHGRPIALSYSKEKLFQLFHQV